MQFLFGALNHLRPIRGWALANEASLALDAFTFTLSIARMGSVVALTPKFMFKTENGRSAYSSVFSEKAWFCGWSTAKPNSWPVATDKIVFKRYCQLNGLLATQAWTDEPAPGASVIVKPRQGSFGEGLRGPFSYADRAKAKALLVQGTYLEQFILGQPAKIWYWGAEPRAIEFATLPYALGDGRRTLCELLDQPRGSFDDKYPLAETDEMLAWQNRCADSVLASGEKVYMDFKYATPFDRTELRDRNSLHKLQPRLREQLVDIGRKLVLAVPPELRCGPVYTVDAVLDAEDTLWLLEMNSNPIVHPAIYPSMLNAMFGVNTSITLP